MGNIEILTREDVRAIVREEIRGARGKYSQLDGERPPGAGREKFLRVWRIAAKHGDHGATTEGRARLLTPEAWARWQIELPRKPKRRRLELVLLEPTRSDRVLARLGGVTRP